MKPLESEMHRLIFLFTESCFKNVIHPIHKQGLNKTEPHRLFYTILFKTIQSLDGANVFINSFSRSVHVSTPLYIILRSILSDVIVGIYIMDVTDKEEERAKLANRVRLDHIERYFGSLKGIHQVINNFTPGDIETAKQEIRDLFPDSFNLEGGFVDKPLQTSPETLIRKYLSTISPKDRIRYKDLIDAFKLYEVFSKYEHLGELSFNLVHRNFNNEFLFENFNEAMKAIELILMYSIVFMGIWGDTFREPIGELFEIEQQLVKVFNKYKKNR